MSTTGSRSHHGRVRARRCAVQALYQWLLTKREPAEILLEFQADREMARVDLPYFERLTAEIPRHYDDLMQMIEPVLDREWSAVNPVERAVLLLGVYELGFCREIPRRVVINEAVELVKMFGAEEGYRYINAVLDKVSRTLRADETDAGSRAV